jgi:hypothetical protein
MVTACTVFELRRYLLHPGRRDELIDLFDEHFVETQEAVGMHVIGQFRVDGDPDRFAWLRGFADMGARRTGLAGFYVTGEAWAAHGSAANATMLDSDDVLLLRPVTDAGVICNAVVSRPPRGARETTASLYELHVHHVREPEAALAAWTASARPALLEAGADVVGVFQSHHVANNFPRLPVRTDVEALVVLTRYGSETEYAAAAQQRLSRNTSAAPWERFRSVQASSEVLRLRPTARSALR